MKQKKETTSDYEITLEGQVKNMVEEKIGWTDVFYPDSQSLSEIRHAFTGTFC